MISSKFIYKHTQVLVVLAAAGLLLSGCITPGASTPVRYYSLPTGEPGEITSKTPRILAGPFRLPEYLNRPQMVIRQDNGRIRILEQDRWAEVLDEAVVRRISYGLRRELGTEGVLSFPNSVLSEYDYKVAGTLTRFEALASGSVELHANWSVARSNGDVLVGPEFGTYTEVLPSQRDKGLLVTAQGRLLDRLSADIAAAIQSLPE
jgi:uncharacterized lipoprotein YmbA